MLNFFKGLISGKRGVAVRGESKKCCGGYCHGDEPVKPKYASSDNYAKRLAKLEESVNAIPEGAEVRGGTYISRDGKRKFVNFSSKQQMLNLLAEAKEGKVKILG